MNLEKASPRRALNLALIILGLAAGLLAGIGGTLLFRPSQKTASAVASTPKKQMYQCPMHPQIIQDHPGDCPICGMTLVAMDGSSNEVAGLDSHAVVTIDSERQQLMGLRTETVEEGSVSGETRATGRIAVDETRVRRVTVKVEGFVEKLFVDFTGKFVAKGAPLFSLYSPEFVSAQREYLLALKMQKSLSGGSLQGSGSDLVESAKRRLMLWDVPKEAIEQLEKSGEVQHALILRSPISGVVTVKNVMEGTRLTPTDVPFEITDLGHVWVLVDMYETELGRAKIGLPAALTLQAFPGKTYQGHIAFVDPILDPKTRTAKVRLEFANPVGELKPEMFGEAILQGPSHKGLLIPRDAVLDAGTTKVAFVALGHGKFEPREITVGGSVGERIEIRSGLSAGDEVVVRANFLVDSESRLKAALAQMGKKP